MKMVNAIPLFILLCVGISQSACQGLYIESRDSGSSEIRKFSYMPHMFRSELPNGRITIVRLDKNRIYDIDAHRKVYKEESFESMRKLMDRTRTLMKKRLQGLPRERRAQLEEQLSDLTGSRGSSRFEVVNGHDQRSISGFSCAKYEIRKDGKASGTVWITNDIAGIDGLRRDMVQFTERLSSVLGVERFGQGWLKEVKGFPVQTERGGFVKTVTMVEHRHFGRNEFEVPGDCARHDVKGLEGLDTDGEK